MPKTVRINMATKGQDAIHNNLTDMLAPQIGQAGPQYGGPRVAGPGALTSQAYHQAGQGYGMQGQVNSAISNQLSGGMDQPGLREYFSSMMDPARRAFDDTLGGVAERFGGVGAGAGRGGAFAKGLADSTANFGGQMAQQLGGMVYNGYNAGQDRITQGLQAAGNQAQLGQNHLAQMFGMGLNQQSDQQAQYAGQRNAWDEGQAYNNPYLSLIQPALGYQKWSLGQEETAGDKLAKAGSFLGGVGKLAGGLLGG